MALKFTSEGGNASLALVLMGGAVLMAVLTQTQGVVSNRLKASQVKKVNLEGQEAGLYALSVARQLLNSAPSQLPAFGFQNPVNPGSPNDIRLRALGTNPNPSLLSLNSDGSMRVAAPDVSNFNSDQMDQIFLSKNMNNPPKSVDVAVQGFSWDPFATGYGIQTIYLEAKTHLKQKNVDSTLVTKAKIEVPPPAGSCVITASANGVPLGNGASVPNGTAVLVNLHCKGVVLAASLYDSGALLTSAGPVTAANTYTSDVPNTLPLTTLTASGNHLLHGEGRLVDGALFTVSDLLITIQSKSDPWVCRKECTCTRWAINNTPDCTGETQYADPYPGMTTRPAQGLPRLSGNPTTDPSQLALLDAYAKANKLYEPGIHWQGAAFPNYPNLLICADVYSGFDLYAFDPDNNCAKKAVSPRGVLGCLKEGTRITVAPGQSRAIEELRAGDRVWNPLTRNWRQIVKVIAGPESKALLRIQVGSHSVVVTQSHPMRGAQGYIPAHDLQQGDLVRVNDEWVAVVAISADAPGQTVWNLDLEAGTDDERAFEADGILVGDLTLQERMEKAKRDE